MEIRPTTRRLATFCLRLSLRDAVAIVVLLSAYLSLVLWAWPSTIDDAFITLRYSKHFAEGYGIVWNIGGNPVEGYSSTFWMLLGTVPHAFNVDPILSLKVLSVIAIITVLVSIYLYGRISGVSWLVALTSTGQIAFNPATAVHTAAAMETAVAMLWVSLSAVATMEYLKTRRRQWLLGTHLSIVMGLLTRPDLIAYAAGLLLTMFFISVARYQRRAVTEQLVAGVAILFLPGLTYLIVRYSYFGYWLPNAFYIKKSTGLITSEGVSMTLSFVKLLLPLGFLATLAGLRHRRMGRAMIVAPLVVGSATFLFVWVFFNPIQADLWRYQIPVFPALVLAMMLLIPDFESLLPDMSETPDQRLKRYVLIGILVISITVFPLYYIDAARSDMDRHPMNDRIAGGKALTTVPNPHSHRILTSESGAVPYYSEWHAIDRLGLNSEYIAHHGIDREFVEKYDPHVVMLLLRNGSGLFTSKAPAIASYLDNHRYEIVAVTTRQGIYTGKKYRHHVYLVASDAPHEETIACALLTMDGVKYAPRQAFAQKADINVSVSKFSETTC